jgi:hypothetical protein
MFSSAQDWLSSLLASFKPQHPAQATIQSARDWLNRPSASLPFLGVLSQLEKNSITVSLPLRIIKAWHCEEANGEDIVYVEAIMPLVENISLPIRVVEQKISEQGEYKIARFLVCREDYKRLLVLQKTHFGLS